MSSYSTVGSNRLPQAIAFYEDLLGGIGMTKLFDHPSGGRVWTGTDGRWFGVLAPHDGQPATAGNGAMTGFALDTREKVRDFHARVLALGGTSEGEPGLRGPEEMGFYFAYARDLDGNKLCAFRIGAE